MAIVRIPTPLQKVTANKSEVVADGVNVREILENIERQYPGIKDRLYDENGNEIFRWGPRPKEAQQLVTRLKSEGMEHDAFVEQLHLWYARNKGVALVSELKTLLTV